jgi:hypothetical protein
MQSQRETLLHLSVREHAVRERDIAPPQREGACCPRERHCSTSEWGIMQSQRETLLHLSVRENAVTERDIAPPQREGACSLLERLLILSVREHAVPERFIAPPQREGACGLRERDRDCFTLMCMPPQRETLLQLCITAPAASVEDTAAALRYEACMQPHRETLLQLCIT